MFVKATLSQPSYTVLFVSSCVNTWCITIPLQAFADAAVSPPLSVKSRISTPLALINKQAFDSS